MNKIDELLFVYVIGKIILAIFLLIKNVISTRKEQEWFEELKKVVDEYLNDLNGGTK